MTIFGATRVRNEGRWIADVLRSYLDLCERVWVFDDGSNDGTPEIAEQLSEKITVIRSPFREPIDQGLNEQRDKQMLMERVMGSVSDIHLRGNTYSPFHCVMFDGDELLDPAGVPIIRSTLLSTRAHAFKLPIRYLWDSDMSQIHVPGQRRVRIDGVYRTFARPSIFRLFNSAFRFQTTPWGNGANFHCSSIPQELLSAAHEMIEAPIWHLGYQYKQDRIRKFQWYSKIDPRNEGEGQYLHCIQGDGPVAIESGEQFDIPLDAKLKWAGPFHAEMM